MVDDAAHWKRVAQEAIAERDTIKRVLATERDTHALYREWRKLRGRVRHIVSEFALAAQDTNPARREQREAALVEQLRNL